MTEDQNKDPEQKPAENEIADYYEGVKKLEMEGHESGIKKARNALFVTAALFLILEAIGIGQAGIPLSALPVIYFVILAVEVGGFLALALLTKTKPYTAIIIGIILFLLLWVVVIVSSEDKVKALTGGIIVRIVIFVNLINALKPAKAWEDLKKNG